MVCMALRVSTHFLIQKSAPPGSFPAGQPRNEKIELKRRLFLYEGGSRVLELSCRTLSELMMNCWLGDEAGLNLRWLPCIQPAFQKSTYKSLPNTACTSSRVWGRHPFGFILASLVTQVAVEDVHSGQRATRGSANVGCF